LKPTNTEETREMLKQRWFAFLFVTINLCALTVPAFAKPARTPKCQFSGDYSFFFWSPDEQVAGVGFFSVQPTPGTNCRAGVVLPGGIINCNVDEVVSEDFIENGFVFLETDGEGTMEIETNSSHGICGSGDNAIELDISVALSGRRVLFTSNAVAKVSSGTIPNAGYDFIIAGRAGKCFPGQLSGCYDIHFWEPTEPLAGDCTICLGGGHVLSGSCSCNGAFTEYLSQIETGGYTLGENCQSSTGFLSFTVSSDEVCGITSNIYLDFAAATGGQEILGSCDGLNAFDCAFEGWLQ
jgi:hypothetical protein